VEDPESTRERVDGLLRRHRSGGGVVGALESLCRAMAEDLALVGAVVTLIPSVGAHAVSACSSAAARQVEEAQFGVGEGPTRDAFTARRPVLVAELRTVGVGRWPGWAPAALAAGVCAVYAFPLLVGASIFGVLTAYVGSGSRLEARRLETALVFSEAATELLLDGSIPAGGDMLEPVLDATLGTNGYIYQAQGMVMVELSVSLPEALARMRAHAWATGQDLTALAQEILDGRTMPTRDPR
jgi:hypothetical protein